MTLASGACGGGTTSGFGPDGGTSSTSSSSGGGGGDDAAVAGGLPDIDKPLVPASKVDLLLVVDNSASMGDKAQLLSTAIPTLIRDLAKTNDLHVGVLSSSLGNFGGNVCDDANPETNTRAHLRTTGPGGTAVPGLTNGVLAFGGGDVEPFIANAQSLVAGVGQTGCGLEAQLETMYRFLVQPDPFESVKLDAFNQADLGDGVDVQVLIERKAFLRPDSALVIVMLTDEDDSTVDPLSVGGQGWAFQARDFPGSKVFRGNPKQGTTAPRPTSACATNPNSPDCTSCGFASLCDQSTPACQKLKQDPNCNTSGVVGQSGEGFNGYYGPTDDELNVRFHRMKERYGVDPQYPLKRYIDGLTMSVAPSRRREHIIKSAASGLRDIAPYSGAPDCVNPIFAQTLPSTPGEELCSLQRGPRSRELVVFALLGGVPEQLLGAGSPQWTQILGQDPDNFNFAGIDPHMIQSTSPRAGLTGADLPRGNNGTDPIHGREWTTGNSDLQYACTFPLPVPRNCAANDTSCDCIPESTTNPPLCGAGNDQVRAKAYPTIRQLRLAKALGDRGVVGSICASNGYDATMASLSARLQSRLAK